jgi:hypothetical protein
MDVPIRLPEPEQWRQIHSTNPIERAAELGAGLAVRRRGASRVSHRQTVAPSGGDRQGRRPVPLAPRRGAPGPSSNQRGSRRAGSYGTPLRLAGPAPAGVLPPFWLRCALPPDGCWRRSWLGCARPRADGASVPPRTRTPGVSDTPVRESRLGRRPSAAEANPSGGWTTMLPAVTKSNEGHDGPEPRSSAK